MTRKVHYLSGRKPSPYEEWSKRHTLGDVLEEQHREANRDQPPFMERNSVRLIVLCIAGLGAIGAAAWRMPKLFALINSYVEVGIW